MGETIETDDRFDYVFSQEEIRVIIKKMEVVRDFMNTLSGTSYLLNSMLPVSQDKIKTVMEMLYIADHEIEEAWTERNEMRSAKNESSESGKEDLNLRVV